MLASRAFAIDFVSGLIRIPSGRDRVTEAPGNRPVLRSLVPALETAFGIEHPSLFPEEIRVLVEALRAGPLGVEAEPCYPAPAGRVLEIA